MDMDRDRRGRRRRPHQERGLRPMHPLLPGHWTSKAVRVAMSHEDWDRFEELVQSVMEQTRTPTQAGAWIGNLASDGNRRAGQSRPRPA